MEPFYIVERDEIDDMFDRLDKEVELAKQIHQVSDNTKFYVDFCLISLMMEEVDRRDIRIYQQIGGTWVAEVKYKGITFINVERSKPDEWKEFE